MELAVKPQSHQLPLPSSFIHFCTFVHLEYVLHYTNGYNHVHILQSPVLREHNLMRYGTLTPFYSVYNYIHSFYYNLQFCVTDDQYTLHILQIILESSD